MSVLYFNGEYIPGSSAKISVYDRSYLFGEGLFESFRSFNSKVPFLESHLNRLEWSGTFLNLDFPKDIDISAILTKLLEKNGLKDARFKIMLSRSFKSAFDSAARSTPDDSTTNLTVFCEPIDETALQRPYKLKTVKTFCNDASPLANLKTSNYLTKIMARHEAQESGCDDAVLLNAKGFVTECTTGSIFWIDRNNVLMTVMEDQGLLSGITAKHLKKLLEQNKIQHKTGVLKPEELTHAKEIFITNSVVGVKPVVNIDARQISGGEIGSLTAMIRDLWNKHIKELTD